MEVDLERSKPSHCGCIAMSLPGLTRAEIETMPIDPEFQVKLKTAGDHNGHTVWGENNPPTKLGIHGTMVESTMTYVMPTKSA